MSSAAQAIANKQNAQASTGPRTQEGKLASSVNALRHGLTSQTVVLPGEDAEAYAELRTSLFESYKPETVEERLLVQTVCDTQWRLERAHALETNLIQLAHHEEIPDYIACIADAAHRQAMITAHGYDKREKKLRNLQLQASRLQKTLLNAISQLDAMRNTRQDQNSTALSYAVELREAAAKAQIPFDPKRFGFDFTADELETEKQRIHLHNLARPRPQPSIRQLSQYAPAQAGA